MNLHVCYFRDQYSETLTQQWVGVFNGIFSEDNYTPIYIQDELEFVSVITQFPFHDEELKNVSHNWFKDICIVNNQYKMVNNYFVLL